MTDWLEQYSAALDLRDAREKAHKPYIDAYTRLADRTAAAVALSPPPPPATAPPLQPSSSAPAPAPAPPSRSSTPKDPIPPDQHASPTDLLTTLRADLSQTQKARATLQSSLQTLTTTISQLRLQDQRSAAQILTLTKQKTETERKLRDREDEIRGKAKLVEQAQDEMVALGLQLNMAEQKSERLERENRELVERWMKRMGEEVERVNRDSRWE